MSFFFRHRSQLIAIVIVLITYLHGSTGQVPSICPTAVWNQTFRVVAGISGLAASTATTFNHPFDFYLTPGNVLIVSDLNNNRVQRFAAGSVSATTLPSLPVWAPTGLEMDSNGTLYVVDTNNCRLFRWINNIGTPIINRGCGSQLDRISTTYNIFLDSNANIYLSDFGNHRVTFWAANNLNISTIVAGGYGLGTSPERLYNPLGLFVDSSGTIYIADFNNHRIQMWLPGAAIGITVAGDPWGAAGPWSYQLNLPSNVIFDQAANFLYIMDAGNRRVMRWRPGASYGTPIIQSSSMNTPRGMRFDSAGNIWIADANMHRILQFALTCPPAQTTTTTPTTQATATLCPTAEYNQTFTVIAGVTGSRGTSQILLNDPYGTGFDAFGNLYVADTANDRIQFYPRGSMTATTVAGIVSSGGGSYSQLNNPSAIHVDSSNQLYILDTSNCRVLRWQPGDPMGFPVAGNQGCGAALTQITTSYAMIVDQQTNIYISEFSNHRVTFWSANNRTFGALIAGGHGAGITPERFNGPWGIHLDSNQNLYIVDRNNHRVQFWLNGAMSGTTVAGSPGDPGPWAHQFSSPTAIVVDRFGFLYVLDTGNSRLQKWWPGANFGTTVLAGVLNTPYGLQMDNRGNMIITDTLNLRVISLGFTCPQTTTTTTVGPTIAQTSFCPTAQWNTTGVNIAGITGSQGNTPTLLRSPNDVCFDAQQNLYVLDNGNHRIQFFPRGSMTGVTIAGSTSNPGGSLAQFNNPTAIYVDMNRVMYVLDTSNFRVVRWNFGEPRGYLVLGGNGNGPALNQLGWSYGMFVDTSDNIYISDNSNHRVTFWSVSNRTAGVLVAGGNGAGNAPERLNGPWGIFVDVNGTMFIVDRNNHRVVRWLQGALSGTTVAGATSDPGPWSYQLSSPTAIIVDPLGIIYVLDSGNNRVQRWVPFASFGTTVGGSPLSSPMGLIMDRANSLVIADTSNHRVVSHAVFCPPTTTTTAAPPTLTTAPVCPTAQWNQTFTVIGGTSGSRGSSPTLLNDPSAATFDPHGNLYVADTANERIQFFPRGSLTGTTIAGATSIPGGSLAQLNDPFAIHVDSNRVMFILDTSNFRVLRWVFGEPRGQLVAGGNGAGSALNQISWSYAMFVDNDYNIYISDSGNARVTLWMATNRTSGILVAGGNGGGNTPTRLSNPWGIFVDVNGSLFIADRNNHRIQLWEQGALSGVTVAGSTSDAGPYAYQLSSPTAVSMDTQGFLYVLDAGNSRIQRWWPRASFGTTVVASPFSTPYGMIIDPRGNLVVTDTFNLRVLSFAMTCPSPTTTTTAPPTQAVVPICPTAQWNQTFNTLAGSLSTAGSTPTLFSSPADVAFDSFRNMYVADTANHRIQRFPPGSNVGTTVAGVTASWGATRSQLSSPNAIHVTANGTMYILDTWNYRVLRWEANEPMGTVVAGGQGNGGGFNQISWSYGMFVDDRENIFISDNNNHRVVRWNVDNRTSGILVAGGNGAGSTLDKLNAPWGVYIRNNATFVVDRGNHRVIQWTFGASLGAVVAGSTSDPGPWSYQLSNPTAISFDQMGFMYILDSGNARVQRYVPNAPYGITIARSSMSSPLGMSFDRSGNIVIADTSFHRIISFAMTCPSTTTTTSAPPTQPMIPVCPTAVWNQTFLTLAGSIGTAGSMSTLLSSPYDVDWDEFGNMYVVDRSNHRVQRFAPNSNTGVTVAGFSLGAGTSRSEFWNPSAIFVGPGQTMFILDTSNFRVLRWPVTEPVGDIVVGGRGSGAGFHQIGTSLSIFVDTQMNIYVSEQSNHRVTLWFNGNTTAGVLVAGGNGAGNTADKLSSPWGIYVDVNRTIFVVDRGNHRVMRWDQGATLGILVAGSTNDPGPWAFQLNNPTTITIDPYGFLYIMDFSNTRVQRWWPGASFGTTVVAAAMSSPIGLRFDRLGNIVIPDTSNHRVISFPMTCPPTTTTTTAIPIPTTTALCPTNTWNQTFSIVAGSTGGAGSTPTLFNDPYDVAVDGRRNIYVVDYHNHRVQRFSPGSSSGITVAGTTGTWGGARSLLYYPTAIFVTTNGTMFILDTWNHRVLRWIAGEPMGTIVAGGQGNGGAFNQIGTSYQLFVDDQFNVYVSESSNHRITRWSPTNTTSGVLMAGGNGAGNSPDKLNSPWGVYIRDNATYIVDRSNHRVQKWDFGASVAVTVAGSTSDPGPWAYQFSSPTSITIDPYGFLYILDFGNERIQKWWPGALYGMTVVAADLSNPYGMAMDPIGNFLIADTSNERIISFGLLCPPTTTTTSVPPTQPMTPICPTAVWNQTGIIIAGATSNPGSTSTLLSSPYDMDFDIHGNMYVVDRSNDRIQRYLRGNTVATTIAGFRIGSGSSRSELNSPSGIHVTSTGVMYILDTFNYRTLRWVIGEPLGFVVTGGRGSGSTFDRMGVTYGMFVDTQENIYLSEQSNHRVTLWSTGNTTAGILVAGGNGAGNTPDKLNSPWGIYVDANRTMFIVDRGNHRVVRWEPGMNFGVTVAGSTSDPGPWAYQFNNPTSITFDPHGFMYVLDFSNSRVQRWWPGASFGVTVIAASMSSPIGLRFDRVGNLVVADTNFHRVLSFSMTCPQTTTTTTPPTTQTRAPLCSTAVWNASSTVIAGVTSSAGSTATLLSAPYDLGFDAQRNLYVVDYNNHRVQRFRSGSNTGTTVAGFSLSAGSSRSEFNGPGAIHVQPDGLMYIADGFNCRIFTWQPGEPMGTVVVNGRGCGSTFDRIGRPFGIFVDSQLNIYVSENTNHRVTRWDNGNNVAGVLVAGGNGAGATAERLSWPWGLFVDSNAGVYVVDRGNNRVQYWAAGAALGVTVAGDSNGGAGPFSFQLNNPSSILFDSQGAMYVLDSGNSRVQRWTVGASFGTTVLAASMGSPLGMYLDLSGNLAIADTNFHRIQLFPLSCPPTTTTTPRPPTQTPAPWCPTAEWNSSALLLAGSLGTSGSTPTFVSLPLDVTFDQYRNMYVADHQNHRIQRYPPGSNLGTTVAGITGSPGGSLAQLNNPSAIFVDRNDGMYILDTSNFRVLKWDIGEPFGRVVVNGRGSGATLDRIGTSYAMFVDNQFNIFVSENSNHRVTKWFNGNNVAGQIVAGGAGSGATSDKLWGPWGIYVDSNDQLYVVDRNNHRVQRWVVGTAFGTTVAGESGVAGSWSYQLNSPTAIMFDVNGLMYILDAGNSRIVRWTVGMNYGFTLVSSPMSTPYGFAFDYSNNIILADSSNHRIVSYSVMCVPTTTAVSALPTLPSNLACQTGVFNTTWTAIAGTSGVAGSSDAHFSSPLDVYVDNTFNIYIADNGNNRIMRYRSGITSGVNIAGFTLAGGAAPPQLRNPSAVFVAPSGAVFIADTMNYRIQKWLPNEPLGTTVAGGRGNGATLDRIGVVYGIFVDAQESIYVSENSNHRVTLWYAWNTTAGELVAGSNAPGNTSTQLNSPWGVHVDANNTVYVADRGNHRIQAWGRGRGFGVTVAGVTGVSGSTATLLNAPTAISIDTESFMYVMDAGNNRIQRFAPNSLVGETVVAAPFNNARGMRLDSIGNLYVADMNNHRILFFRCVYNTTTTTLTTATTTTGPTTSTTTTSTTSRTTSTSSTSSTTSATTTTTRTTSTSATTTTTSRTTSTTSTSTTSATTTTTTSGTGSTTTSTSTTTTSETTTTTTSSTTTSETTTTSPPTTTTTSVTTTTETTTTPPTTTTVITTTTTVTTTTTATTTTTTTAAPTTTIPTTAPPTTTGVVTTTTTAVITTTAVTVTTVTTTAVTTTVATVVTTAVTVGTTAPVASTTGAVVIVIPAQQGSGSSSSSSSSGQESTTAMIVGSLVGGLAVLGLCIGIGIYLYKSLKGASAVATAPVSSVAPTSAATSAPAPPPSKVTAPNPPPNPKPAPPPQSQAPVSSPPKAEAPPNVLTDAPSTNSHASVPMNVADRAYKIHIIK